jgi:hypothetical protein
MPALATLTRAEKLRMMEALWDDLTRSEEAYPSPAWHGDALQETESARQAGEVEFIDWDAAKKLLREGKR